MIEQPTHCDNEYNNSIMRNMSMRHSLMSMRCSNQHKADNILKVGATHMISIINSNFNVKKYNPTILNQPYSQTEYITVNPNK